MNSSLIAEVEGIMEMIEVSIRSTAQYGESLQALSQDIANTATTRTRLREIVTTIIANTRDVTANNRTLEARMRESRSEIEGLRETLEAARLESLTDALTGLGNRKSFETALHRACDAPEAGRRDRGSARRGRRRTGCRKRSAAASPRRSRRARARRRRPRPRCRRPRGGARPAGWKGMPS